MSTRKFIAGIVSQPAASPLVDHVLWMMFGRIEATSFIIPPRPLLPAVMKTRLARELERLPEAPAGSPGKVISVLCFRPGGDAPDKARVVEDLIRSAATDRRDDIRTLLMYLCPATNSSTRIEVIMKRLAVSVDRDAVLDLVTRAALGKSSARSPRDTIVSVFFGNP